MLLPYVLLVRSECLCQTCHLSNCTVKGEITFLLHGYWLHYSRNKAEVAYVAIGIDSGDGGAIHRRLWPPHCHHSLPASIFADRMLPINQTTPFSQVQECKTIEWLTAIPQIHVTRESSPSNIQTAYALVIFLDSQDDVPLWRSKLPSTNYESVICELQSSRD